MPLQTTSSPNQPSFENYTIKVLHTTRQESQDDSCQMAFSVIDDTGRESVVTAELPDQNSIRELGRWLVENGYLRIQQQPSRARRVA